MAGEKLGEAILELRTDDQNLDRGIGKAEQKARGLGKQFEIVTRKAIAFGAGLAAGAAAAASALGVAVKKTIDHADAMSKAARRAGVTTEALSELAWAAELSDVGLKELTSGLQRLSYNMAQAATGADKTLSATFKKLGIDITDASGRLRNADTVMIEIADRLSRMEAGADKTALAMRIFGRSGVQMLTMLDNGKEGLEAMAEEARRLGLVISTDFGNRSEAFNDAMTRIQKAFKGVVIQIAERVMPYLEEFADLLTDPSFIADAQAMAMGIAEAMGWIVAAIREVIDWMRTMGEWWEKLKGWTEWAATHDMFGNKMADQNQPLQKNLPVIDGWGNWNPPAGHDPGLADDAFDSRFNASSTPKTGRLGKKDAAPGPKKTDFRFTDLPTGSGKSSKSGRSGKSKAEEYRDIIQQAEEFIASQGREQQALTMTAEAAAALRFEHELLNDAKRQDIKLSPEQREAIRKLAEEMASAEAATGALSDSLDFRRDTFSGFFADLKSGLKEGQSFWDAFQNAALNALDKITDRILNQVLDAVFQLDGSLSGIGSSSSGGGLFGMLGGLFSGFFATGGLIPNGSFGIVGENGPEPVIGTASGAKVLPNSALSGLGGGAMHVTFGLASDGALNIMPEVRSVSREEAGASSAKVRKDVPSISAASRARSDIRGGRP